MDIAPLLELAKANPLIVLIVLGLLLFKGDLAKVFSFLKPKPDVPPVTLPDSPTPAPAPVPAERPIIDAILKILPVVLPLIVSAVKDAEKKPE